MKFTFTEWTILSHRLEVSDAIAECLIDELSGERWTEQDISEAADNLLARGNANMTGKSTDVMPMSILDAIILREAGEGSTFFAGLDDAVATGEINKDQRRRYHNAADVLESMLEVTIPRA